MTRGVYRETASVPRDSRPPEAPPPVRRRDGIPLHAWGYLAFAALFTVWGASLLIATQVKAVIAAILAGNPGRALPVVATVAVGAAILRRLVRIPRVYARVDGLEVVERGDLHRMAWADVRRVVFRQFNFIGDPFFRGRGTLHSAVGEYVATGQLVLAVFVEIRLWSGRRYKFIAAPGVVEQWRAIAPPDIKVRRVRIS